MQLEKDFGIAFPVETLESAITVFESAFEIPEHFLDIWTVETAEGTWTFDNRQEFLSTYEGAMRYHLNEVYLTSEGTFGLEISGGPDTAQVGVQSPTRGHVLEVMRVFNAASERLAQEEQEASRRAAEEHHRAAAEAERRDIAERPPFKKLLHNPWAIGIVASLIAAAALAIVGNLAF